MTKVSMNSFERLSKSQKDYILRQVIRLGDLDAVEAHYAPGSKGTRDLVSRFAIKMGKEMYK